MFAAVGLDNFSSLAARKSAEATSHCRPGCCQAFMETSHAHCPKNPMQAEASRTYRRPFAIMTPCFPAGIYDGVERRAHPAFKDARGANPVKFLTCVLPACLCCWRDASSLRTCRVLRTPQDLLIPLFY